MHGKEETQEKHFRILALDGGGIRGIFTASFLATGEDLLPGKICLATSAAPLYLPGIQIIEGDSHVDGGLFANNPTLVGLTEAVKSFGQPLDRIRILSVGAGERAERIPYERARRMGLWHWRTA